MVHLGDKSHGDDRFGVVPVADRRCGITGAFKYSCPAVASVNVYLSDRGMNQTTVVP